MTFTLPGFAASAALFDRARATDRLSHAYLFQDAAAAVSPDLFAFALWCAASALCRAASAARPCGSCPSCRKVAAVLDGERLHPDLHILPEPDAEPGGTIKIDEVRAMLRALAYRPNDGESSVYLIRGAELLTAQAQNALLKSLEEPPEHAIFLLLCGSSAAGLLPTVRSRSVAVRIANTDDARQGTASETMRAGEAGMSASELLFGYDAGSLGIERPKTRGAKKPAKRAGSSGAGTPEEAAGRMAEAFSARDRVQALILTRKYFWQPRDRAALLTFTERFAETFARIALASLEDSAGITGEPEHICEAGECFARLPGRIGGNMHIGLAALDCVGEAMGKMGF